MFSNTDLSMSSKKLILNLFNNFGYINFKILFQFHPLCNLLDKNFTRLYSEV